MFGALPIFQHPISPTRHIELVGKAHKFLGGAGIVISLLPILLGLNSVLSHSHDLGGLALYVGLLWLAQALPAYLGGRALLKGANWGRILLIIACGMEALVIPIGPVWAAYCWWVLFRRSTRETFGVISDDSAQQARQMKQRVVWRGILLLAYGGLMWMFALDWAFHYSSEIPGVVWLLGFVLVGLVVYWRLGQAILAISSSAARGWITAVLVVLALLPTWDLLPGLGYFGYLCKTEGGLRVVRTANSTELGRPFQYSTNEADRRQARRSDIDGPYEHQYEFGYLPFTVMRSQDSVVHRETSERLGALTQLYWVGGWVMFKTGRTQIGIGCPSSREPLSDLFTKIFEPTGGPPDLVSGGNLSQSDTTSR